MHITPLRLVEDFKRPTPRSLATHNLDCSVIIPTLNEAENLPALLDRISTAMGHRPYEVIIVDDGSTDATPAVCEELARRHPLRLVVRHRATDGLSGAVLHGIAIARGQFLIVMDADLQHPPEAIPYLLAPLKQGDAEFVIGSRYVPGGTTAQGWSPLRRLNSAVATCLARPFTRGTHDPMSGFFALRRETYQRAARLNPLGYKIALELLCKCRARRVMEVPIHFGVRTAGESKLNFKQQIHYLRHLARLYTFAFPRTTTLLKAAVGGSLGYALSRISNPALTGVLTVLSAITLPFLTRNRATSMPTRRQLLDSERIFRFDELDARERAA